MKKISIIILFFVALNNCFSQTVNWKKMENDTNLLSLNAGWDYSVGFSIAYAHKLNTKMPLLATAEYSFPTGKELFDDFKIKLGGQLEIFKSGNFGVTTKANFIFRRFESVYARFASFGFEPVLVVGLYKPKWFVAGEFGFDKAISTHIKNSDLMKSDFPGVVDGWYIPTGGNYNYGVQTGYSFIRSDITLRIGRIVSQGFETTPLVPYYFQLGYNHRF